MKSACKGIFGAVCLIVILILLCQFCSCSDECKQRKLEQVKGNDGATYNIVRLGNHQYIENGLNCGTVLTHYEDCDCKGWKYTLDYVPPSERGKNK